MRHEYNEKMFDVHTTSILRNVLVHSGQFLDQAWQPLFVQNFTQMQKMIKNDKKWKSVAYNNIFPIFWGKNV